MSEMRSSARLLALAAACVLAVMGTPSAGAKDRTVSIRDNYYGSVYVLVFVGDTVTWRNDGDTGHTVTAHDRSFDSSPMTQNTCASLNPLASTDCIRPDETFAHTFDRPGTYDYYCKAHGDPSIEPDPNVPATEQPCGMCGVVEVRRKPKTRPSATESPTTSPSPSPSESESASPSPSPSDSTPPPEALDPTEPSGSSGGGRVGIAFLTILALSGAGYYTWRRFLAPR
jgi:plastocyanin